MTTAEAIARLYASPWLSIAGAAYMAQVDRRDLADYAGMITRGFSVQYISHCINHDAAPDAAWDGLELDC